MDFSRYRHGADEVARMLGQAYSPTPQQRAVIEAGAEPALVVAGAGSGKTETMSARVVWLVANGLVAPGEVLGLTFTRKAAGELGTRIRGQIDRLRASGNLPGAHDPLDVPSVSTYNSFANALFRENALAIGREADGVLLGEAAAWRLARTIVGRSTDPRLLETEHGLDRLTGAVLDLAHALSDNDVPDPRQVTVLAADFQGILDRPSGSTRSARMAEAVKAVGLIADLPLLIDLAVEFAAEKRRRGLIEYSDQVAFALQAVQRRGDDISAEYRSRYKVVLLDEYQDTSFIQTDLLAGLFRGHPVMAVGDPNQSIYGWRGASADNLDDFSRAFTGAAGVAPTYPLTISWRNPTAVLDAANLIAAPLNAKARVDVERLDARADAPTGAVEVRFEQTILDEAAAVAAWFAAEFAAAEAPPTAALLMRSWSRTDVFTRALRDAGIRYHVLGLGGLLEQPAVVDLVCALKVLVDPDAGSELLRLLAGARWRLGVRDIQALRGLAGWLEKRDFRQQLLDGEVRQQLRGSVAEDEGASIVEALDFIGSARREHGALADFSPVGLERLREAARFFENLRGRLGLELLDLVTLVIQELDLDIEVRANESAAGGQAGLDAFLGLAAGFNATDDTGTGVRAFLDWLYEAEGRERFSPRTEAPEPGSVQVLTIHGSKGLEWNLVAVPRLVADELPGAYRDGAGWVRFGQLPFDFRGDRSALPVLAWRTAETQKDFLAALDGFKAELTERHLNEERCLGYVAVTRASERLLLTGSYWGGQSRPRDPSTYLAELAQAGLIAADAVPPLASDENPLDAQLADPVVWPKNPLRGRETAVRAAAEAVRHRLELGPGDPARDAGLWRDDLELLLRELEERRAEAPAGHPPVRIPASRYKDFVSDPEGTLRGLKRPMPERPYKATRIGTLFHAWVERRAGVVGQAEVIDAEEFERDDLVPENEADAVRLADLKATFERSRWAGLKPLEVEVEIHAPLAGQVFVCKLDAVYPLPDGRVEIVDWKTGKAPKDDEDLERKQFQLALYRHAYATWKGVPPESIDAVFYFVADDAVIRPERIYSSEELAERWSSTFPSEPSASSTTGVMPAG
ncbi:MAG: ATP-dependent helicase [Microbacteriaceae bacterium]|nr:ATP-dependent helicase [Microbacteriaceae bacterium]MCL2794119.1 ATP-dependent helicase [Microbacteriaceae bacterium]